MNARRTTPTRTVTLLALIGAFGLTACKGSPPPGGDHHQWLTYPGSLDPTETPEVQVTVAPKDDAAGRLVADVVDDVLTEHGYTSSKTSGIPFWCLIDYSGDPKTSPVTAKTPGYARVRGRWKDSGWPSCVVILRLRLRSADKPPMTVALWTDSGATEIVLTRTGHVRRTGSLADPDDLMLEPGIAFGLREVLHSLFPKADS